MPGIATDEVLSALIDPATWHPLPEPPAEAVTDPAYAAELSHARDRCGRAESVVTGRACIDGSPVVVIAGDFSFLAGSVGVQEAAAVVAAFDYASALGLPVVASPVSGGTRMQEGTPAFLQMVPIAAAVARHRAAGLPYLTYLRHPTTGGVFATWGSLGDLTFAQPESLVGFLGPRVFQALYGRPFPAGVQLSERLSAGGLVDQVLTLDQLRATCAAVLAAWSARPSARPATASRPATDLPAASAARAPQSQARNAPTHPDPGAWPAVLATRDPARPGAAELLAVLVPDLVELSGTGRGEPADGLIAGVGTIAGTGVVVVAQDRGRQRATGGITPASLRTYQRAVSLAGRWGMVLLAVVDTPGAVLSAQAELGGLAREIAGCLARISRTPAPVVGVLLGEGTGGAALAMLPADYVLAAGNAWLTPLPPEGAAAIVWRDPAQAPRMAAAQRITAAALAAVGAVDEIVPEQPGWLPALADRITAAVAAAPAADPQLSLRRAARWSAISVPR